MSAYDPKRTCPQRNITVRGGRAGALLSLDLNGSAVIIGRARNDYEVAA
jgi:hypothetical protein